MVRLRKLSFEGWCALIGFTLGIVIVAYSYLWPTASTLTGHLPNGDFRTSSDSDSHPIHTLGSPIDAKSVADAKAAPDISAPGQTELVAKTTAVSNAVIAIKLMLLSDDFENAYALARDIPAGNRDLVIRSALSSVYGRITDDDAWGDWFAGDVSDPYSSLESRKRIGMTALPGAVDAIPNRIDPEKKLELAKQRISETVKLLKMTSDSTQAYWYPYLVMKLRKIGVEKSEDIVKELVDSFRKDIPHGLTEETHSWIWTQFVGILALLKSGFFVALTTIILPAIAHVGKILVPMIDKKLVPLFERTTRRWFPVKPSTSAIAEDEVSV